MPVNPHIFTKFSGRDRATSESPSAMRIPLQKPAGFVIARFSRLSGRNIVSLWQQRDSESADTTRAQESKPPKSFVPGGKLFAEMLEKSDADETYLLKNRR